MYRNTGNLLTKTPFKHYLCSKKTHTAADKKFFPDDKWILSRYWARFGVWMKEVGIKTDVACKELTAREDVEGSWKLAVLRGACITRSKFYDFLSIVGLRDLHGRVHVALAKRMKPTLEYLESKYSAEKSIKEEK